MLLYIAQCFRSAVVKLLLCLMTAPICVFCVVILPLKFIKRKQYRAVVTSFCQVCLELCVCGMIGVFNGPCQMAWIRATWWLVPSPILHISGDIPDATRPRIIIANHQVGFTWSIYSLRLLITARVVVARLTSTLFTSGWHWMHISKATLWKLLWR